ncbi:hypothetical protein C8R46DRAFT_1058982 [Mycena filopes]|nr:hypothetical protein C8R46DRAFT_1058982 [Mycena filopes]
MSELAAAKRPAFLKATRRASSAILMFRTVRPKKKVPSLPSIIELEEAGLEEIQTPGLTVLDDIYNTRRSVHRTRSRSDSYKQTTATPTVEFTCLNLTEGPMAVTSVALRLPTPYRTHVDSDMPMAESSTRHLEPATISAPSPTRLGKRRRAAAEVEEDEPDSTVKRQRTTPRPAHPHLPRRRSTRIAASNASRATVHTETAPVASIPPLPVAVRRKRRLEEVERGVDEICDDAPRYAKRRIAGRST